MWLHVDLNRLRSSVTAIQVHLAVNEAYETLHAIQDGLNL
jgi:hypothetical protein